MIEVLSLSTRDFDTIAKLSECKDVASVRQILFVEPNMPLVVSWERQIDASWKETHYATIDEVVPLTAVDAELPLRDIYVDIIFPEHGQRF